MGEKMSLQQVRDWHRRFADTHKKDDADEFHNRCADAIDAHLTQPAQAVDAGAIREVIAWVERNDPHWSQLHKLTAALPKDSNGAEGVGS